MTFMPVSVLLLIGANSDIKDFRIPNYLIFSGWLIGMTYRLYQSGWKGMGSGLISIVVSIMILFPLYMCKAVGAGDIKLLSVISGVYGLTFWAWTSIIFFLLAAAASFVRLLSKRILCSRFQYFFHYLFGRVEGKYYDPDRDGRDAVIPMAPLLLLAYIIYYFCQGGGRLH